MILGLLTFSEIPELTPDDHILCRELDAAGVSWCIVDWNQTLPPDDVTHLLIRSPWDYYYKAPRFLQYLADCEAQGVQVINSPSIVRWNYTKKYLLELEQEGLTIVPSVFAEPNQMAPSDVALALEAKGWNEVVIKPDVSGTSYLTFRTRPDSEVFNDQVVEIFDHGTLIAQPYLPSIREEGEMSLIYFQNEKPEYSHTVQKVPKSGDFRVQNDFGGSSVYVEPSQELKDLAESIIDVLPKDWLYVRIDLVDCKTQPLISEIEMIEPALYFAYHPPAARRLAEIIKAKYS